VYALAYHVVVVLERGQEGRPVPGLLESHGVQRPEELVHDPLLDELLEGPRAVLERRQVVHGEAGHHGEEEPAPPEPLVDEPLGERAVGGDDRLEHRAADLRVPRLVALDARDHFLEHAVADVVGERRETEELEIGEAGLEDEMRGDRELDRVRAEEKLVDEMACRDRDPVVRMVEAVRPVELGIVTQQIVQDEERDLGVPELVESAHGGGRAPRARSPEPRAPEIADDRRELGERERRSVELQRVEPHRIDSLPVLRSADGFADRVDRGVLPRLSLDILSVRRPVRLVPGPPIGRG
jgi:hypothetical protein